MTGRIPSMAVPAKRHRTFPMKKSRFVLPAVLWLGACSTSTAIADGEHYSRLGMHYRAFHILDEAREQAMANGGSVPPELEEAHGKARKSFLYDRARGALFLEQPEQALADLGALLAIDPDNEQAKVLRAAATRKKAEQRIDDAQNLLAKREYAGAMAAFLEAESIQPSPESLAGQLKVRAQVEKQTERAQQQFLEAVRKLPEFRYSEVRWHSSNALADDPARRDAEALRTASQLELVQQAMARGKEHKDKERFGAALLEFREAKRLCPTTPGLEEEIAAVELELKAGELVDKGQVCMRRGDFDGAKALFDKAHAESIVLRGAISELQIELRHRRGDRAYQAARDFEIQGLKREALAGFEALGTDWPEGFSDEKARIDSLKNDIEMAAVEYAAGEAAETAGDLAKAAEHFAASDRYYGKMKDAKARATAVREKLAKKADG